MNTPLVSIITVNFKQPDVTCELLNSLKKISYKNIEIWVVDNFSDGALKARLNADYPEVKVIESKKNLGFAGGNNLAITQANGKYLMLLNNDTEVKEDFLEPLVEVMENNSKVGICSSKLHYFYHPEIIQYAGSSDLHPYKIQSFAIGYGVKDMGQYDEIAPTNLAHGAAMMVRAEAVKEAGLMPEEFFLYYEEIDWCMKIREKGYLIYFVPKSLVLHKESISVGKQSALQVYYKTRNRILLARKWRKGLIKWFSLGYLSMVAIRDIFKFLLQRKFLLLKMYADALIWNLKGNYK
ncbi:glycosyl transferase family 2 [Emticicia oligotrophica DSM 17448]|uniref:Glycosyl transferase family 2 n=1 Tax=Emticicia oligotrophica (strain DSM 17448 / CIP 109782 / MTCC 6937 / GPTSA100-15) TaxID=929562 RepID=A0ABM5N620_EMTOG|nr:glycosyltransferase family 2 protein [Emticicia oligotrophica]AFK04966.1 glycosyl transferase family 2 [Emticicia oligotrophica DSM 17448]